MGNSLSRFSDLYCLSNKNRLILFLVAFFANTSLIFGQVGGTVWQELPVDGSMSNTYGEQDANEFGLESVEVIVYNSNGTNSGSILTDATGDWSYASPVFPVRVEFTWSESWLEPTVDGNGSGLSNTAVQFVSASSNNINLGLHYPRHYTESDPRLAVSRYVAGDNQVAGIANSEPVIMGFRDSYTGEGQPGGSGDSFDPLADGGEVGTTWGIAYQKRTETIFVAASYRRHASLGPLGTGGIYSIDYTNKTAGTVSNWLDVNSLGGQNTGSDPRSGGTDLNPNGTLGSYDWRAYPEVGRISLGDIDISDDEQTLYVVNLNQKTVIPIDIGTQTISGSVINIPNPGCSNGDYAPWSIAYYQGSLYLGVVCTAETSQDRNDLEANVYRYDLGAATFTNVLSFPLDYERGFFWRTSFFNDNQYVANWKPWTDDFFGVVEPAAYSPVADPTQLFFNTAQPILSDIEFDETGAMILGFADRLGLQTGYDNFVPDPNEAIPPSQMREFTMSGGDILRACPNGGGTWTIENDASCGGVTSTSNYPERDTQGPGGKEFYNDAFFLANNTTQQHQETALGGLAGIPGSERVISSVYDPLNEIFDAGGVKWYSRNTGAPVQGYQVYRDDIRFYFSKAGGLGDVELLSEPMPIEIGNLVWNDINMDGVQDPDEPGISGITVELFDGSSVVATAVTDGNGNYIFSNASGTNTGARIYGLSIDYNTSYTIRIPNAQGGSQQAVLSGFSVTVQNNDGSANGDARDSDGSQGNDSSIDITLGFPGQNNHSYDIGFSMAQCNLTDSGEANETCNDNGTTLATDDYISFDLNPMGSGLGSTYNVTVDNGAVVTPTSGNYGSATSFRLQDGSADGSTTFTITITDADDPNCTITTTVSQSPCSSACPPNEHLICDNDSNIADLVAESGLSNYVWYEYDELNGTLGVQVGTGQILSLIGSDIGPAGSRRCYVYTADDAQGCPAELCCPVCVITEQCCPDPNCYGIQITTPTEN